MSDDGLAPVVTMALLSSPDISKYDIDLICSSVLGYHPMNSLTMALPMHDKRALAFQQGGHHYDDVIMSAMASQITSLTIVYSTVYSGADHRKHQSYASLAFVRGIPRSPVNSPHKWPVTRKMFPFHDVIMLPMYDKRAFAFQQGGYQLPWLSQC